MKRTLLGGLVLAIALFVGHAGVAQAAGQNFTMGYDSTATFAASGLVTVIRADHTWTHYQNLGAGITVLNSGTWSPGIAVRPNRRSGGPSNVK